MRRRKLIGTLGVAGGLGLGIGGIVLVPSHLGREKNENQLEKDIAEPAERVRRDIEDLEFEELVAEELTWSVNVSGSNLGGSYEVTEIDYRVPVRDDFSGEDVEAVLDTRGYVSEAGEDFLGSMAEHLAEVSGNKEGINTYTFGFAGSEDNVLVYSTAFDEMAAAVLRGDTVSDYFEETKDDNFELQREGSSWF